MKKQYQILFSIVTPIYNTRRYLGEFLDSIARQSYTNFHLYLVDDGSTDNSGCTVDNFMASHPKVKIFLYRTENKGVSSARNFALDKIKKNKIPYDYVCFFDSDDILDANLLKNVNSRLDNDNIDYVVFPLIRFTRLHTYNEHLDGPKSTPYLSSDDAINLCYLHGRKWRSNICGGGATLNKIIKADIALRYRFDTSLKSGEDCKYINSILASIRVGLLVDNAYYFYRLRKSSLSNALPPREKFKDAQSVYLDAEQPIHHLRCRMQSRFLRSIYLLLKDLYRDNNFQEIDYILRCCKQIKFNPLSVFDYRYLVVLYLPRKILYMYLKQRNEKTKNQFNLDEYFD